MGARQVEPRRVKAGDPCFGSRSVAQTVVFAHRLDAESRCGCRKERDPGRQRDADMPNGSTALCQCLLNVDQLTCLHWPDLVSSERPQPPSPGAARARRGRTAAGAGACRARPLAWAVPQVIGV